MDKKNTIDIEQESRCVIARGQGIVYIDDTFSGFFNTTDEIFKDTHLDTLVNTKSLVGKGIVKDWWDLKPGYYSLSPRKNFIKSKKQNIPCRIDHINSSNNQSFVMISITTQAKDVLVNENQFAKAVGRLTGFMERLGSFKKEKLQKDSFDVMVSQMPSHEIIEDFRQFFNLSVDILVMADKNGRITKVNPSFRRLLGYSSDDIKGKYFRDLIHPDDRQKDSIFKSKKKMVSPVPFDESRFICKDKSIRWLEWKTRSLGNMTYIVASDVTSHKIYQSELAMRESQLRDAQKMASMGYWNWKIGQKTVHFSSHLYEVFNIDNKKFKPTVENVQKMVGKRDLKRMQRYFERMLNNHDTVNFDFKIKIDKKKESFVRCYGRCETNIEGNVVALYGLLQDITDEKKNRRDLIKAKQDAEASLHSKSRFLANMSHELRTPLNAIIGFSEVMKSELLGPIGSDQYTEYIAGINESGQHLLDIISDILDMSKMESGKYEIVKEKLSLTKSIRLAIHMIQSIADESQVSVNADVPDEMPSIYADRRSIMQVLTNLLSNAVKFNNPGGNVFVSANIKGDNAVIVVKDTGIGIPSHKISSVTKPFEQAAGALTRGHSGTGLGLAITKNQVELHGGALHIESEEGIGTEVTVSLPVRHPDSTNDNKTAT